MCDKTFADFGLHTVPHLSTNYCPRHCAEAKSLIFVLEVFAAFLAIHCPKCSPVQFSPYSSQLAFNAENCDKTKIQHFTDFSLKKTFFRKYFQFEIFQTSVSIFWRENSNQNSDQGRLGQVLVQVRFYDRLGQK